MPIGCSVLIDDLAIGRCQRVLLSRALTASEPGTGVRFLSEQQIAVPEHWKVEPAQGKRLAALLDLLRGALDPGGRLVFLSGALIIEGELDDPFAGEQTTVRATAGKRLATQLVLAVDQGAPASEQIRSDAEMLKSADFHVGTDAILAVAPLPQRWRPGRFRDPDRGGALIDCLSFDQRPWYRASAPAGAIWRGQFNAARLSGDISQADIEADVDAGLLRPSILFEVEYSWAGDLRLPASIAAIDGATPYFEARPYPEKLQLIATTLFPMPFRIRRSGQIGKQQPIKPGERRPLQSGIFGFYFFGRRNINTIGDFAHWLWEAIGQTWRNPRATAKRVRRILGRLFSPPPVRP